MKACVIVITLGLLALSTGASGYFLHFDDVELNRTCGTNQGSKWSVQGTVKKSPSHAFFFQSQVVINLLQELCTIDLTKCPPENLPTSATSCYCKSRVGDKYNIHIGSQTADGQKGMTLQATMPAQGIFPDTFTSATIGQMPYVKQPLPGTYVDGWYSGEVYEKSPFYPYYQIDDGKYTQLMPTQTITLCTDKPIFLQISFHNPPRLGELTLKVGETTIKTSGPGIRAMHKFKPQDGLTAVVEFRKPNECTHVKYIHFRRENC